MGFAVLFKMDDSCLAAHAGERREKLANAEEDGEEERKEKGRDGVGSGAGGGGSREKEEGDHGDGAEDDDR